MIFMGDDDNVYGWLILVTTFCKFVIDTLAVDSYTRSASF